MYNDSKSALTALQKKRSSGVTQAGLLSKAEGRLGVSDIRKNVQSYRGAVANTENLLRQVEPSVQGRTSGSLVSDAQRSRLVNLERQPISEQLVTQKDVLSNESANLSDTAARALAEAQLGYGQYRDEVSGLESLYNTLYKREQDQIALEEQRKAARAAAAQQQAYLNALANQGGGGGSSQPYTNQEIQQALELARKEKLGTIRRNAATDANSLVKQNTYKNSWMSKIPSFNMGREAAKATGSSILGGIPVIGGGLSSLARRFF